METGSRDLKAKSRSCRTDLISITYLQMFPAFLWKAGNFIKKEKHYGNRKESYDAVIVGGGPAGLSAAIYLARAKYRVLVVAKDGTGGQISITSEVVNYPGIEKISGKELTASMRRQAENFGAEFVTGEVLHMELEKEIKEIKTTRGDYKALGVVLATGANPRKIGFKGEREFQEEASLTVPPATVNFSPERKCL